MDSYWDLYVAYVNKCVRDNWINDIDPHHYEMEWNHFLPQCVFGDQPVGHYLLIEQHAIASALQTLALGKNCLCGWHKKHLPEILLNLSWKFYSKQSENNAVTLHSVKDEEGKSLVAVESGKRNKGKKKNRVDRYNADKLNSTKNKEGKSVNAVKGGKEGAKKMHSVKNENGKSKFASEGAKKVNAQRWVSTIDGFESNAGLVARHNKENGWDPSARIRIS
jgi:hypothetical protein